MALRLSVVSRSDFPVHSKISPSVKECRSEDGNSNWRLLSRATERPSPPEEHLALRFALRIPNLFHIVKFLGRRRRSICDCPRNKRGFGRKNLKSDGHLITEDSVLPTTAPGGAPERNRCYQTPATLLILPLAPAAFARSARLAPLTSLRPRWGLALFEWLRLQ